MGASWKLRGYVVEELLGSGGGGDVWRARVATTGEQVALKRIPTPEPDQARRAQDEAALLSQLDHPHLVRLHALVPTAQASVLVLDLADGGSLADLLDARGRLSSGEVITAVAPIAAALAYLHDEGVVHGDVSAANILFSPDGVPLLADLGVARLTGDDSTDVACTPAYIDPAVAAGSVPGPPSDVFMLAAVAMHALTAAPPWPAQSGDAALALAARGELDDVAERFAAAGVTPQMSAVLCRALSVDPHRRGSAADLALDLRHSGEPVAVELAAGRARQVRSGPRHAARPVLPGPRRRGHGSEDLMPAGLVPGPVPSAVPADPSRPAFERPALLATGAGGAPPTRMAGPRPRPVIPRPGRRHVTRRTFVAAAALTLLALLGTAGTIWAHARRPAADRPPHPDVTRTHDLAASSSTDPLSPRTPTARTARGAHGGATTSSSRTAATSSSAHPHVLAVLDRLDAARARAFATRRPAGLGDVYVDGPLLDSDTALLTRLVPSGCGLRGVRTHYTALAVARRGDRIAVTVTAELAPSRLICAGAVRGRAPGTGPTSVHLELVPTSGGMRIARQQVG